MVLPKGTGVGTVAQSGVPASTAAQQQAIRAEQKRQQQQEDTARRIAQESRTSIGFVQNALAQGFNEDEIKSAVDLQQKLATGQVQFQTLQLDIKGKNVQYARYALIDRFGNKLDVFTYDREQGFSDNVLKYDKLGTVIGDFIKQGQARQQAQARATPTQQLRKTGLPTGPSQEQVKKSLEGQGFKQVRGSVYEKDGKEYFVEPPKVTQEQVREGVTRREVEITATPQRIPEVVKEVNYKAVASAVGGGVIVQDPQGNQFVARDTVVKGQKVTELTPVGAVSLGEIKQKLRNEGYGIVDFGERGYVATKKNEATGETERIVGTQFELPFGEDRQKIITQNVERAKEVEVKQEPPKTPGEAFQRKFAEPTSFITEPLAKIGEEVRKGAEALPSVPLPSSEFLESATGVPFATQQKKFIKAVVTEVAAAPFEVAAAVPESIGRVIGVAGELGTFAIGTSPLISEVSKITKTDEQRKAILEKSKDYLIKESPQAALDVGTAVLLGGKKIVIGKPTAKGLTKEGIILTEEAISRGTAFGFFAGAEAQRQVQKGEPLDITKALGAGTGGLIAFRAVEEGTKKALEKAKYVSPSEFKVAEFSKKLKSFITPEEPRLVTTVGTRGLEKPSLTELTRAERSKELKLELGDIIERREKRRISEKVEKAGPPKSFLEESGKLDEFLRQEKIFEERAIAKEMEARAAKGRVEERKEALKRTLPEPFLEQPGKIDDFFRQESILKERAIRKEMEQRATRGRIEQRKEELRRKLPESFLEDETKVEEFYRQTDELGKRELIKDLETYIQKKKDQERARLKKKELPEAYFKKPETVSEFYRTDDVLERRGTIRELEALADKLKREQKIKARKKQLPTSTLEYLDTIPIGLLEPPKKPVALLEPPKKKPEAFVTPDIYTSLFEKAPSDKVKAPKKKKVVFGEDIFKDFDKKSGGGGQEILSKEGTVQLLKPEIKTKVKTKQKVKTLEDQVLLTKTKTKVKPLVLTKEFISTLIVPLTKVKLKTKPKVKQETSILQSTAVKTLSLAKTAQKEKEAEKVRYLALSLTKPKTKQVQKEKTVEIFDIGETTITTRKPPKPPDKIKLTEIPKIPSEQIPGRKPPQLPRGYPYKEKPKKKKEKKKKGKPEPFAIAPDITGALLKVGGPDISGILPRYRTSLRGKTYKGGRLVKTRRRKKKKKSKGLSIGGFRL